MITIHLFEQEDTLTSVEQIIEYPGHISEFLVEKYKGTDIPFTVYKHELKADNQITFNIGELSKNYDEYVVVETTADLAVAAIVLTVVSIVYAAYVISQLPDPKPQNTFSPEVSPSNQLGARANRARPLQRIPDIKGRCKIIPDVIAPTYYEYFNSVKTEYGFYCVGRGDYEITDVKDGKTSISTAYNDIEIYNPYHSPNNSSPDVLIGTEINVPIRTVYSSYETGRELLKADEVGSANLAHLGFSTLYLDRVDATHAKLIFYPDPGDDDFNLSPDYAVGNYVQFMRNWGTSDFGWYGLNSAGYPTGTDFITYTTPMGTVAYEGVITNVVELAGPRTYEVTFEMSIPTPDPSVNVWGHYGPIYVRTKETSIRNVSTDFTQDLFETAVANIRLPNGLFKPVSGGPDVAGEVVYRIVIDTLDEFGVFQANVYNSTFTISLATRNDTGATFKYDFATPTRFRIKVDKETTDVADGVSTSILDVMYGYKTITQPHFGNVTTMFTRSKANISNLSKDRELNCVATEKLYKYLGGGVFDTVLSINPTSAVQSYIKDFIDPVMGNRPLTDLDADGLLAMEQEIIDYFGDTFCTQFNYILDSSEITFEEYTKLLFTAINSTAYREGNIVRGVFESVDKLPTALYTHRSKIPDGEKYTRNMNKSRNNDGVELVWVNPAKDWIQETYFLPEDRSAVKPKKLEIVGITNYIQAARKANRDYNKIKFAKMGAEFTLTPDARFLKPNDVFYAVKGTRTNTADGEVIGVSTKGLNLTLSQDVEFGYGVHSITLKLPDGSVENIPVTAGSSSNIVRLKYLPSFDIIVADNYQRGTEFSFGNDETKDAEKWIATSIDIGDQNAIVVEAINFTQDYYLGDSSIIPDAFDEGFDSGFA